MNKLILPFTAIVLIASLEVVALSFGINGLALSLSVGAICTIVGWSFGKLER
ncbi:hypothetical protein ES703_32960 [subsurface metagenome]